MTQPSQPTPPAAPIFPAGRYGHRRDPAGLRRRRLIAVALAALTVLVGVVIAVRLYQQYGAAPYQVSNVTTTNLTDTGFTVRFTVSQPAGKAARCTIVGHTREGREVGRGEVAVPAAGPAVTSTEVTFRLPTTARAVIGEVQGCGPG